MKRVMVTKLIEEVMKHIMVT
jgi:hypothetical protein